MRKKENVKLKEQNEDLWFYLKKLKSETASLTMKLYQQFPELNPNAKDFDSDFNYIPYLKSTQKTKGLETANQELEIVVLSEVILLCFFRNEFRLRRF